MDVGVDLGVHLDRGPWRIAGRVGPAVAWMPPTGERPVGVNPYLVPHRAGWMFGALGITAAGGYTVGDRLAVDLVVRPALTTLDLDGDREAEAMGWLAASALLTWAP
jgi:hypothetical protein